MPRALLFDFNGVLVDDEPIHLELFQRVLGEEGVALGREDYYRSYLGLDDRGCFNAVLTAAGEVPAPPRVARLVARKASYYRDLVRQRGYPFFAPALELAWAVAGRGWVLGVVSGALREEVEMALVQADLRRHFKVLVAAEDVAASKPDPEGYRRAIELLNSRPPLPERLFHPHEVVAIEDSPAGLQAAAGAGLATLAVATSYPAGELGVAGAVVESLDGMTPERLEEMFG